MQVFYEQVHTLEAFILLKLFHCNQFFLLLKLFVVCQKLIYVYA